MEKNFKLIEEILKNSQNYRLGQVDFTLKGDHFLVWSTNKNGMDEAFHGTDIIQYIPFPFSCYVSYDKELQKCILYIF